MRVLMVSNTYEPARNGVASCVGLSVRELRARGHEVDVLTYRHSRRAPGDASVLESPAWFGVDGDFQVAPVARVPEGARHACWDVVHIHHPVLLGWRGLQIAERCGAASVFTAHSVYTDYFDEYALGLFGWLKPWFARKTARFVNCCDTALAPSSHVAEELRAWGVTVPVRRLDAAADTGRVPIVERAEARARLGLAEDAPVALFAGRIAHEKRVDDLVDEFAVTSSRVQGAVLALAGDGPRRDEVAHRAKRLGLDADVRFLGSLPGSKLAAWYAAADVNVSASLTETGPLSVVEAMACGTPSVAWRGPGFEDRIESGVNGLLAERRPGALGEAVAAVLGDAALRERLAAGARAGFPAYTPEKTTDDLLGVYAELLERRRRP